MLCGSLKDNVENIAEDGGLSCEISEGKLKTLFRAIALLIGKILWL
jgi:predicted nucleic acid-binding Zn ribbon protein